MAPSHDLDDRLSDLPPLPPLGEGDEDLGPDGDALAEGLGDEADERVGLDASEGMPEGLEAHDLVDDLDDEPSWAADGEGDAGLVPLENLVEADEAEYGHTDDTEAGDTDEALMEGVIESVPPVSVHDDGAEGVDDVAPMGEADGDDDAVGLPPLDADEPEGLDDPFDDSAEEILDLPALRDPPGDP
jgi:hypothetical protein